MQRREKAMKKETTQVVGGVDAFWFPIRVHLEKGKVVKVEGDFLGDEAAVERLYHPNRLKYPQKRVGEKGEGKWERISWDEALGTIAEKLNSIKERYGAEFVAFDKGNRRDWSDYVNRLANVFGTPNMVGTDNVCYIPSAVGRLITFGYDGTIDWHYPAGCVLWWGARRQPPISEGTKSIVVNILKTEGAAAADVWLQPRPATDLALALAMLNVIVNEELYDKAFVEKWTVGFDKLREHVQRYPPEKVEQITWVPAEKIVEAARLFAKSKPAYIGLHGHAIEDNLNSVQCSRAQAIMVAITGNLDIPGGYVDLQAAIPNGGQRIGGQEVSLWDKLPAEARRKKIGADVHLTMPPHPLWDFVDGQPLQVPPPLMVKSILEEDPYLVKALCIFGSNPILTWSNTKAVYRALKKLDFLVVTDVVMTPTAALADIVLPAASYLEEDCCSVHPIAEPVVLAKQKVVQIGECWPVMKILIELAKRLGLREYFWEDVQSFNDACLETLGITFDELRKKGVTQVVRRYRKYEEDGFNTPSGKVEVYSSLLEQWGYDPIPVYHEPPETPYSAPELAKEYPLILASQHEDLFYNSQDRHLENLLKEKPGPITIINPETATKLGIQEGDEVYIENKRGRVKQKAVLNAGIDPRVVSASFGWWFPEEGAEKQYGWEESNINLLTDDKPPFNPEMGSTNLKGFCCKVYKA
jgi:anaerobic selenocysteine-containing dehydrogenase